MLILVFNNFIVVVDSMNTILLKWKTIKLVHSMFVESFWSGYQSIQLTA